MAPEKSAPGASGEGRGRGPGRDPGAGPGTRVQTRRDGPVETPFRHTSSGAFMLVFLLHSFGLRITLILITLLLTAL